MNFSPKNYIEPLKPHEIEYMSSVSEKESHPKKEFNRFLEAPMFKKVLGVVKVKLVCVFIKMTVGSAD